MSYSHGKSETMKLADQIIDRIGYVKANCGVKNDSKRLRQLKNKLEFSSSIAEVSAAEEKEKQSHGRLHMHKSELWY